MTRRRLSVAMVMTALLVMNVIMTSVATTGGDADEKWQWTTASPGLSLQGTMVTLSYYRGGISFYPPYFSLAHPTTPYTTTPDPTTPYTTTPGSTTPYTTTPDPTAPYPTTPYPTTTTKDYRTPAWTTASYTSGVSVCVRYLTDYLQTQYPTIFTLSPRSDSSLTLKGDKTGVFQLSWDRFGSNSLWFSPSIRFWPNVGADIWNRVCVTVDTRVNEAQVFSGSNMSIRKMLPAQYVWGGQPVIDFEGFDGHVTDVQVWDYPISYSQVFRYMSSSVYGTGQGSVLTWSHISYSLRGDTQLEAIFEWRTAKTKAIEDGRGHPKEKKNIWNIFKVLEDQRERNVML